VNLEKLAKKVRTWLCYVSNLISHNCILVIATTTQGYRVLVVEQTETPEQLELRRKAMGIKDKVCFDSVVSVKVISCVESTSKCDIPKFSAKCRLQTLAIFRSFVLFYNSKHRCE